MMLVTKISYTNIKKTKIKQTKNEKFFFQKKIQFGLFSRMFFWVQNEEIMVFVFFIEWPVTVVAGWYIPQNIRN